MQFNPVILNATLGLSLISCFIMTISSFVFASYRNIIGDFDGGCAGGLAAPVNISQVAGINNGEGFLVVVGSLGLFAFIALNAFYLNKRPGKSTYSHVVASTSHSLLLALLIAVFTGVKVKALDHLFAADSSLIPVKPTAYQGAGYGVVAGASLLIIFQSFLVAQLILFRSALDTDGDSSAYSGPSSYQPNSSYANYGAENTTTAAGDGAVSYQSDQTL